MASVFFFFLINPPQLSIVPTAWSTLMLLGIAASVAFILAIIVYVYVSRSSKQTSVLPRVVLVFLISFLALGFIMVAWPTGPASLSITKPSNNGTVHWQEFVEGESQNLGQNSEIWVVIKPLGVERYYPQSFPVDLYSNGKWTGRANFGEQNATDIGRQFQLIAVLADSNASNAIHGYLDSCASKKLCDGLKELPQGAVMQDVITVTKTAAS